MFIWTEKKFLRGLVDETMTTNDIDQWFPEYVVRMLRAENRLRCITDKVMLNFYYFNSHISLQINIRSAFGKGQEMWQPAEIVKLHTDFDTRDFVKSIVNNLDMPFHIFVDYQMVYRESKSNKIM